MSRPSPEARCVERFALTSPRARKYPTQSCSSAAVQHVGSPLPDQTITSRATADRIVAGASVREILASAGGDRVGVRVAIDPIRSGTASHRIGAVAAADPVVPLAAVHDVVPTQPEDDVVPGRAAQDVGAVRAGDRGLAREAEAPLRLGKGIGDRDQDESRHDERDASQHAVGAYVALPAWRVEVAAQQGSP